MLLGMGFLRDRRWGAYAAAVARWEKAVRPAPLPMRGSLRSGYRLNPIFVEWMMGVPAGWFTDVPGVTDNQAIKLAGNGVVPQQAAAALSDLKTQLEMSF